LSVLLVVIAPLLKHFKGCLNMIVKFLENVVCLVPVLSRVRCLSINQLPKVGDTAMVLACFVVSMTLSAGEVRISAI